MFCACAATAAGASMCDGGAFGRLTLPEDATDRGPEPFDAMKLSQIFAKDLSSAVAADLPVPG
jgi:hypothetical protein